MELRAETKRLAVRRDAGLDLETFTGDYARDPVLDTYEHTAADDEVHRPALADMLAAHRGAYTQRQEHIAALPSAPTPQSLGHERDGERVAGALSTAQRVTGCWFRELDYLQQFGTVVDGLVRQGERAVAAQIKAERERKRQAEQAEREAQLKAERERQGREAERRQREREAAAPAADVHQLTADLFGAAAGGEQQRPDNSILLAALQRETQCA